MADPKQPTPHVIPAAPQPPHPASPAPSHLASAPVAASPRTPKDPQGKDWDPSFKFDPLTGEPIPHPNPTGLYDGLIALSGLVPGDMGWLTIDPATGGGTALTKDPPAQGTPACRVMVQGTVALPLLMSATGAELGPVLQPNPDFRVIDPVVPPVLKEQQAGSWSTSEEHPHNQAVPSAHVAAAATAAPKQPAHK